MSDTLVELSLEDSILLPYDAWAAARFDVKGEQGRIAGTEVWVSQCGSLLLFRSVGVQYSSVFFVFP